MTGIDRDASQVRDSSQQSSDMVERRDLAWGRNALAFIRERGLETEFSDWCGGWPMPEKECAPNGLLNELVGRAAHQRATTGDSSFADIGHAALEASHHVELVEALASAKVCIESTCNVLADGKVTDLKLGCIGFASREALRHIDALSAKIGCDQ